MMLPHHRSYYIYFEDKHKKARRKTANRRMTVMVALLKMRDKKCTIKEYHFFFGKLKNALEIDVYA